MIDYWSEAALFESLSEALHFFGIEIAELPAPRIPREDLEGIALLRNRCLYRVVERLGDGDVDSDSNRRVSLDTGAVLA